MITNEPKDNVLKKLKSDALSIIGPKVELNPFTMAIIDYEVELLANSTINQTPYAEYYAHRELLAMLLQRFALTVSRLLQPLPANHSLTFRGIALHKYIHNREQLLFQIAQLATPD